MILHLDGDAFFASVEQAQNPKLRGKPVVSGGERGIATAVSYEAKALGVPRGLPVFKLRKLYPMVIVTHSSYHLYSLYSKRMFNIVRRYTSVVEEYSIDECFAHFSPRTRKDFEKIMYSIKHDVRSELGITVSLGLAPTKVLAKVASKIIKPDSLTIIEKNDINKFLRDVPINKIWGIGPANSIYLQKKYIQTALNFTEKPYWWVKENCDKPLEILWRELRGEKILEVDPLPKSEYKSFMKTGTFSPSTNDKNFLLSELSKHIENACRKARFYGYKISYLRFYLKTAEFSYKGDEVLLNESTNSPGTIFEALKLRFNKVWKRNTLYRATGISLSHFTPTSINQNNLFSESNSDISKEIWKRVDSLESKFGRNVVHLASSLSARRHDSDDEWMPSKKFLSIPSLGEVN